MGMLLARLRGWSPLGPIFGKELRVAARRKRNYALRSLYLGALLLVLLCVQSGFGSHAHTAVQRARQMAELGETFFVVFAFFTWFAMALIGPVLTSTAINAERLRKTLPVLMMTPITAWQIVSGKLFSRLLIALSLMGLSLPVLAVVRLLGGVEIGQMAAALCLCTATVLFTAAVGLLLSVLINRPYAVILLSYAVLGFLWMMCPIVLAMIVFGIARNGRTGEMFFTQFLLLTNPCFTLGTTIRGVNAPGMMGWWGCVAVQMGLAGLLVGLSGILLRRRARKESEGSAGGNEPALALPPLAAGVEMDEAALKRRDGAAREVSDNPVLWREVRQPLLARQWQRIVATMLVLGCLLLFYVLLASISSSHNVLMEEEVQIGFVCVFCGLMTLLTCIVSATAIAQEKESDTWMLLLATPLTARQIVWGKFAGLLRRMMWPMALIVGHCVLFGLVGAMSWGAVGIVLYTIVTGNVLWLATGLHLSLRCKGVITAVVLNLLGPVVLYGATSMGLALAGHYIAGNDDWAEAVGLLTPYYYMAEAIDHRQGWWINMPWLGSVHVWTFHTCMLLSGLVYASVTGLILYSTTIRFDGMVGRAGR